MPPVARRRGQPQQQEEESEESESREDNNDNDNANNANEDNEDDDDEDNHEDEDMNPLIHLPDYVLKRVEQLKELDGQRDTIMQQYMTARSELEQTFTNLLQPVYEQRVAIVGGERDSDIALTSGVSPPAETADVMKGVPHFWVTALSNHETTGELVTEEDVDCLEYLKDISCVDDVDGKGFTITFTFAANDYFTDTVLTKRYQVPNLLLPDEPMIQHVYGCIIHWKDDRSLTFRKFQKKQRGKGKKAGQIRTVTKTEKKDSFFHWFEAPVLPSTMQDLDEEEVEQLEELFGEDFDVAQAIRCEICPRAIQWYTGEAAERDMLEMMTAAENGEG